MGNFCKKCGKIMKKPQLSHCSDECILADMKGSESLDEFSKGVNSWDEETDPWK